MTTLTRILTIVLGFAALYLVWHFGNRCTREPDITNVSRLNEVNDSLTLIISDLNWQLDTTLKLVEESKAEHIPDTVYEIINNTHNEKIDSIAHLDINGTVRELSRWLSEADTLRGRHAETEPWRHE